MGTPKCWPLVSELAKKKKKQTGINCTPLFASLYSASVMMPGEGCAVLTITMWIDKLEITGLKIMLFVCLRILIQHERFHLMIINSAEPLPNINNPLSSIQENRIQKNRLNPRPYSNCDSVKTVPGTDKFCNEKAKEISNFCRKVGSQDQTIIVMTEVRWRWKSMSKDTGKSH